MIKRGSLGSPSFIKRDTLNYNHEMLPKVENTIIQCFMQYGIEMQLYENFNSFKYTFFSNSKLPDKEEYKKLIEQSIAPLQIKDYKVWIDAETIILSVASKSSEKKVTDENVSVTRCKSNKGKKWKENR